MPDLFLIPDERVLLVKWDYLASVFRIASRDLLRVLAGEVAPDRHRTVIIQTVSDMLDLEVDIVRMGKDSPALAFADHPRAVWQAAAEWVRELRDWRFPHDTHGVDEIEDALLRRQAAEERFRAVLAGEPADDGVAGPTLVG